MGKRAIEQKQMNVLVTGGSGFLGLALCRALVKQGHQVCSYQRSFSDELEQLGVIQVLGALHDKDKVLAALQNQDAVIHNAAKASGWGSWVDFYQTTILQYALSHFTCASTRIHLPILHSLVLQAPLCL